jgi:YesN/AraC family two-component response regulator
MGVQIDISSYETGDSGPLLSAYRDWVKPTQNSYHYQLGVDSQFTRRADAPVTTSMVESFVALRLAEYLQYQNGNMAADKYFMILLVEASMPSFRHTVRASEEVAMHMAKYISYNILKGIINILMMQLEETIHQQSDNTQISCLETILEFMVCIKVALEVIESY